MRFILIIFILLLFSSCVALKKAEYDAINNFNGNFKLYEQKDHQLSDALKAAQGEEHQTTDQIREH